VSCKLWWTNREGSQHMWWAIVETRPGSGYPKDWEKRTAQGVMPEDDDYEAVPEFTYQRLVGSDGSQPPRLLPVKPAEFGPNWDDDIGEGTTPSDTWFFHLHMACMHCTEPSCVAACPTKAIYRRPDGIVLINQALCKGFKACIQACPYKRIFWNDKLRVAEKCILCYPLIAQGKPPACVFTCTAGAIFFGDLNDPSTKVSKLVNEYKVALPLHGEYATQPNIYYIPPVITAVKEKAGSQTRPEVRVPQKYMLELFGPQVKEAKETLEEAVRQAGLGKPSPLVDILISHPTYEL